MSSGATFVSSLASLSRHGYRGHDARHNLFFSGAGKLVYHAAGVGVVMDPVSREQSFFQGHDDDVVWCALSPVVALPVPLDFVGIMFLNPDAHAG